MSKETAGGKWPVTKADLKGQDRLFPSRVFSADLDGIEFEKFHQYRRAFVEMNASAAGHTDPAVNSDRPARGEVEVELRKAVDTLARDWISRAKKEKKTAAKSRAKLIKAILRQIATDFRFLGRTTFLVRRASSRIC